MKVVNKTQCRQVVRVIKTKTARQQMNGREIKLNLLSLDSAQICNGNVSSLKHLQGRMRNAGAVSSVGWSPLKSLFSKWI